MISLVVVAAFLVMALPPVTAVAEPTIFTCTNPVSGARWPIGIDLTNKTVDSWPVAITDRKLRWHNLKDHGHYALDRATGALTITRASSTGGYQLHASCRPG